MRGMSNSKLILSLDSGNLEWHHLFRVTLVCRGRRLPHAKRDIHPTAYLPDPWYQTHTTLLHIREREVGNEIKTRSVSRFASRKMLLGTPFFRSQRYLTWSFIFNERKKDDRVNVIYSHRDSIIDSLKHEKWYLQRVLINDTWITTIMIHVVCFQKYHHYFYFPPWRDCTFSAKGIVCLLFICSFNVFLMSKSLWTPRSNFLSWFFSFFFF
jgi:hypothetical protein